LNLNEVAAIGDSLNDKYVLDLAGFSAVSKNVNELLDSSVEYISPYSYSKGVLV